MNSHRPMPVTAMTTFDPTEPSANFVRLPKSGSAASRVTSDIAWLLGVVTRRYVNSRRGESHCRVGRARPVP